MSCLTDEVGAVQKQNKYYSYPSKFGFAEIFNNMKITFILFEILLLMCVVFGADKGEVKLVSVMEGDSVTLNSDPTQVIEIRWWFGEADLKIAQIDEKGISFPSERFKGRLQLSQTGSLTISNMRINDSGRYKLRIDHRNGTSNQEFTVTVSESPSVISVDEAEMKIVSVIEGDPVTLHVPQIHGDELIVWRSGYEGKLIAKHDIEAKSPPLYNTDERFRDRLQLDHQTGSLIITNSRTTDSGLYQVKISSNKQTLYKRFTVTVSEPGVSPGAAAGIVVVVLLVAAAVAAGVFYYFRPRISQLPSETWSVFLGDDVTLNPDTEIQTSDEIQWLFGAEDTLIAEIKKETGEMITYDGPGVIFKNRFKLDKTTGSLTIMWIKIQHTGLYTLKIRRGRKTLNKRFQVSVNGESLQSV
ncbi:uncharacterized protein LOC127157211 [Labeo rohita]|uniref:uncharacterized protein LOC127157211 n=1 Tax=Labeo rohita TaxID=84645 RepID=UPI0021E1E886|nr:uncharacterized protein LOC127157211 [Labeo rohita]